MITIECRLRVRTFVLAMGARIALSMVQGVFRDEEEGRPWMLYGLAAESAQVHPLAEAEFDALKAAWSDYLATPSAATKGLRRLCRSIRRRSA